MLLKYFYNEKLAQASYMVGCQKTGEAIMIDPGRDIQPYLEAAEKEDMKIVATTETHIHADYISGSRELADRAGATLYLSDEGGEGWQYLFMDGYPHQKLYDGSTFMIGNIKFEVMHTPGHTPEHISFILTDTAGANKPMGIFTGDFVFVGSIGRPDLLEKAAKIKDTAEKGAKQMYDSVQRFKALPDYLQVWPGHGAGSACGKGLGAIPSSTVGYEKLFNPMLNIEDEREFIDALLAGQPEPPTYFAMMKKLNKEGPAVIGDVQPPEKMPFSVLKETLAEALVIDTRSAEAFAAGHIPGSINIPAGNAFTNWAGWFLSFDEPFYLITGQAMDVNIDLQTIGLDNLGGYFDLSVLDQWGELQSYQTMDAPKLAEAIAKGDVTLVDVRNQSEWEEGHIAQATHIMLGYLPERVGEVPVSNGNPVALLCRSGNRSAIAASILQAKGIENVINMEGGINLWSRKQLPVVH
ncbi:MAG: MBL fold metallo-hydrolase [Ardenticatenaceae bacterium]|nr:MBL fold metallo-hydrolase [Ardenticatenaceae bacterium]